MRYCYIICMVMIIFVGCSTQQKIAHKDLEYKKYTNNIQSITSKKEGTTPKFVVYEEEPIPIKMVRPEYPENIKKDGIQGQVIVRAEVYENGSVGSVEILQSLDSSSGGLDESAIKAVKQWRFIPAKNKGKPVAVWVTFPISFKL